MAIFRQHYMWTAQISKISEVRFTWTILQVLLFGQTTP